MLAYAAVSTLPEPPLTFFRLGRLDPGDTIAPLSVLATAANKPFGTDINCWEDSPSEWGKRYRFGTLPFGDPSANISTRAPFHMSFASQTVASIVVEVTDDKSLPKAERKRCKSSRLATRVAKQN